MKTSLTHRPTKDGASSSGRVPERDAAHSGVRGNHSNIIDIPSGNIDKLGWWWAVLHTHEKFSCSKNSESYDPPRGFAESGLYPGLMLSDRFQALLYHGRMVILSERYYDILDNLDLCDGEAGLPPILHDWWRQEDHDNHASFDVALKFINQVFHDLGVPQFLCVVKHPNDGSLLRLCERETE